MAIKEALATATLLVHLKLDAPTSVVVDASDTGVGGVLQQRIDCEWCLISFFLKKLRPNETRYSTFDRELLAIYLAVKHFLYFLEGRQFRIYTDHKLLTLPCPPPPLVIPLAPYVTWTSSPNSQPTSYTSREQTIVQLMLCLESR